MGVTCSTHGRHKKCLQHFLLENLMGRGHLGKPRRRCEDNIGMYHREIMWEGVDWIHLAQDKD